MEFPMSITIFLSPRFTPDSRIIQQAALSSGWRVERLHKWGIPRGNFDGQLCVYGETLFARFIEENLRMQLLDPPVDWLVNLPEEARRREVKMMKVEDARKLAECRFIKPIDDKTFKAAVMNSGAEIPAHLGDEELVLVAEPVAWEIKFRF